MAAFDDDDLADTLLKQYSQYNEQDKLEVVHTLATEDGRVYSGVVAAENKRVLKLGVANETEPVTIAKSEIESRKVASVSMMPDGLLDTLNDNEVLDLLSYLKSMRQLE